MSLINRLALRAVACGVFALGAVATGADRARITLVPYAAREGVSDAAALKVTKLIAEELRARTDMLDVVPGPTTLGPPLPKLQLTQPSPKRAPSADAVAALEAGSRAFDDLRFDEALKLLRRGIDGLLADPSTADFAAVADGYVKLAASAFRVGDEREAKNTLQDLARLAPLTSLPSNFPPVFAREFDKAKKRLEKLPRGQVSVEAPVGSTAYINGQRLARLPALETMTAGLHFVRIEGPRGERFGQAVDVKPGLSRVRASFSSSPFASPPSSGSTQDSATPLELSVRSPVDEAMLVKLQAYTRAAQADFALFGIVLRTSTNDSQLQLGSALYSARRNQVSLLSSAIIDPDAANASTEVFRLVDEASRRAASFGAPTALPVDLSLASRPPPRASLTPTGPPSSAREPVALTDKPVDPVSDEVKPSGVPAWVWVATGVVVASGAAVGGYFIVQNAARPVTGTVTATW